MTSKLRHGISCGMSYYAAGLGECLHVIPAVSYYVYVQHPDKWSYLSPTITISRKEPGRYTAA